jgi:hypothetical protein
MQDPRFHRIVRPGASSLLIALALIGCGSQQLRLTAPDTAVGIGYTCTSANTCYPASVSSPEEGTQDNAIPMMLPRECNGSFHEIVVRNADSSSPEIDVTCAKPKPALGGAPAASTDTTAQ